MKIYLAGGMKSDWRSLVKGGSNHTFYDPCDHGFSDPTRYTFFDLEAVRHCDLVFAYLEEDSPSGLGLSYEMGLAKGLGKRVIFVNGQNTNKYTFLLENAVDVVLYKLIDGIELLGRLELLG